MCERNSAVYTEEEMRECLTELRRLRGCIREQYEELQKVREEKDARAKENEQLKKEINILEKICTDAEFRELIIGVSRLDTEGRKALDTFLASAFQPSAQPHP